MTVLKSMCGLVIAALYILAATTAFGCDDTTVVVNPTPVVVKDTKAIPEPVLNPTSLVCELIRSGKLMPLIPVKGC